MEHIMSYAKHADAIRKFWIIADQGRSAALDIDNDGNLLARFTVSNDAAKVPGVGTPPAVISEKWQRIAICINGVVQAPK